MPLKELVNGGKANDPMVNTWFQKFVIPAGKGLIFLTIPVSICISINRMADRVAVSIDQLKPPASKLANAGSKLANAGSFIAIGTSTVTIWAVGPSVISIVKVRTHT